MKAERRHELKHNELADWLGERVELLRPHATGILLGLVLLAAIVVGTVWYFGGENHAASAAWSSYFASFNDREPQKALETLARDQSGSKAAWWALVAVADMHLGQGTQLLHTDRTEAQKHLDQAKSAYTRVEAGPGDPMLLNRARLGLAKTYESLCQPDEARKYYDLVAANDKSSAIGKAAAEAAQRLKGQRDVEFLAWFAKQAPKRPVPMPGMGGSIPGLPGSLSDRPDIGLTPGLGLDSVGNLPAEPRQSFPLPDTASPDAAKGDKAPEETSPADKTAGEPAPDVKKDDAPAATATPKSDESASPALPDKSTPENKPTDP